ncbi:MAG: hypothetical protein AAGU05_07815 [Anaerolineaceae bacterium]
MKKILGYFYVIWFIFMLAGCAAKPAIDQLSEAVTGQEQAAQEALSGYLDALLNGRYQDAAGLYGGSYEVLQGYNPEIDPEDRAALLEAACTFNGFLCLEARNIQLADQPSATEFVYTVEFTNADGSLFVLGPCCGADETTMLPLSVFKFTVQQLEDGTFVVMDLPPYTP